MWKPTEEPFRVVSVFRSNVYGLHGWTDRVKTFATLKAAREYAATIKAKRVYIQCAMNAETWAKNGYWKKQ